VLTRRANARLPGVMLLALVGLFAPTTTSGCGGELASYRQYQQLSSARGAVRARFLGTSSILFEDGRTWLMSDGFFSRPRRTEALSTSPKPARAREALQRIGVTRLDAIFTGHSHYDHAMDAPLVAKMTDAELLGSESTRQVGLGAGLSDERIRVLHHGETRSYGDFELTFLQSAHSPHDLASGKIPEPLETPAPFLAWKSDTVWSVLITHQQRTILVHGSAGFKRGVLVGRHADVVYLGIATLGTQPAALVELLCVGEWRGSRLGDFVR
jgi:L-ascorbate metabolism protein UlaG (beta-lactamase superfamily)